MGSLPSEGRRRPTIRSVDISTAPLQQKSRQKAECLRQYRVLVSLKLVAPDDKKDLPTGFEIQRVVDLAGRFKGSNTFIEDARRELPRFYKEVVQNVANWVPRAPKYKEEAPAEPEDIAMPADTPTAATQPSVLDSRSVLATATLDPDEVT